MAASDLQLIEELRHLCEQVKVLQATAEKLSAQLSVRIGRSEAILKRPDRRKPKR